MTTSTGGTPEAAATAAGGAGAEAVASASRCVLEVAGLNVSLGRRAVIGKLDLEIRAGECVGLIGPNGSGKSTLLKALMGLLPARGSGRAGGGDLFAMTELERAKLIAYLPQDPDVAWPIAVEDLVMLGRAPHRNRFAPPSEADLRAVAVAIEIMDLEDFRHRSARALSGGERARVLIARALAQETPMLLADEPTAGLDPAHQIALMATFRDMAKQGRSVLTSLHDLALAAQWCDRLLLLDQGGIAAAGAPRDVLTPDNLKRVYGVTAYFGDSEHGPIIVPVART